MDQRHVLYYDGVCGMCDRLTQVALDADTHDRFRFATLQGEHARRHLAEHGGIDLKLEVLLSTKAMRDKRQAPVRVSHSNLRDVYWTFAQMVAHHSSNGCNLRPGDLIASGTVSGPAKENRGCLLELTWRGKEPVVLPSGEERRFLEDGDEVVLRGRCEREGFASIGFGECRGVVA